VIHFTQELILRTQFFVGLCLFLLLLSACGNAPSICPPVTGTPQYLEISPEAIPTSTPGPSPTPFIMDINKVTISIDRVIEGPLCNDTWSGTVYVTCNVQVYAWQEKPTFLKNCDLNIEPGTVVYVAYHNNTAYYNGCSCHTGETAGP
jgi:hypothetical protein